MNTPNNAFWAIALEMKSAHTEKEKKYLISSEIVLTEKCRRFEYWTHNYETAASFYFLLAVWVVNKPDPALNIRWIYSIY